MDFELLKQLKQAGFPLKASVGAPIPHLFFSVDGEAYIVPSLSELIKAYGNKHLALEHAGLGWIAAIRNRDPLLCPVTDHYATPEEAVAHLWLILHANGDATA